MGIDDYAGPGGSCRVKVLVDGKPRDLGKDGELSAHDGPLSVQVDVKGAKELTLVVEFGRRGGMAADVDWVDARLVK